MRRRIAGLTLAALVSACGIGTGRPSPVPPPTLADAVAHLAAVEADVRSGDLGHLCDTFGSGTCRQELRDLDPSARPTTDPIMIGTGIVPPETYGNGAWSDGGRLIRLCGRDGLDKPYYSEMLVFLDQGRLISIGSLYWLGIRIATSPIVDSNPASPPPCPA